MSALFEQLGKHGGCWSRWINPATIGALPVAVAATRDASWPTCRGLAMRRSAHLYSGQVKTDAREADVIADAARTLPHTLRRVDARDEVLALGEPAWSETRRS